MHLVQNSRQRPEFETNSHPNLNLPIERSHKNVGANIMMQKFQ